MLQVVFNFMNGWSCQLLKRDSPRTAHHMLPEYFLVIRTCSRNCLIVKHHNGACCAQTKSVRMYKSSIKLLGRQSRQCLSAEHVLNYICEIRYRYCMVFEIRSTKCNTVQPWLTQKICESATGMFRSKWCRQSWLRECIVRKLVGLQALQCAALENGACLQKRKHASVNGAVMHACSKLYSKQKRWNERTYPLVGYQHRVLFTLLIKCVRRMGCGLNVPLSCVNTFHRIPNML